MKYFSNLYNDPKTGFAGVEEMKRKWNEENPNKPLSSSQVKNLLHAEETYTKHKPIKLKFPTRKVFAPEIDFLWQADLVEMPKYFAAENNGFNYILTVIDVFSKYAFAREIKRNNGNYVTAAFENIFKTEKRVPEQIQTDDGNELINKQTQALIKNQGIHWFSARN